MDKINKPHKSRWTCDIHITEQKGTKILKGNFLHLVITSEPIPEDEEQQLGYFDDKGNFIYDAHPFVFFLDDQKRESKNGVYEELIADNEVTRAILDICSSPEKINNAAPSDWTQYRATLLSFFNRLWV